MSNVFTYTLNPGYYFDSWVNDNRLDGGTPIATKLVNTFNEALQHYNREEFKREATLKEVEPYATLKDTKYYGLAPTIDYRCDGTVHLNGLDKVEFGNSDVTQILSGFNYNNTNDGINVLVVDGVQDHFRYGTGSFVNADIYYEQMTKRCRLGGDIVFYVELEPIYTSTWISGTGTYFANYDPVTGEYSNRMTITELNNKYKPMTDDNYVLKNFYAYDNRGGTVLPRPAVNTKNTGAKFQTTPYVKFTDKFSNPFYIPVWGMLFDGNCPNYGQINLWNSNTPKLMFTPYLHKAGYFSQQPILRIEGSTSKPNDTLLDGHRLSFQVGNKAEFKKFFDDLGLITTFIEDEAINKPVEEWVDPPVKPPVDPPVDPDIPDIVDPDIPPTPPRPDTGDNNGSGGQEGGEVDNEHKPPVNPDSDNQEDGSTSTGIKQACVSWAMTQAEITELNICFLSAGLFDNLASWFLNPQDAIISLIKFPFSLPDISTEGIDATPNTVIIGGLPMNHDKGVVEGRIMHHRFKTNVKICSFNIQRFFNSYLDYEPYTKVKLYLPYIGLLELGVDYVMGKTIDVFYDFNYIDGSVLAIIKLAPEFGGHVIQTVSGQVGVNVPVAKSSLQENLQNLTKSTAGAVAGVLTMGAGAIVTSNVIQSMPNSTPKQRSAQGSRMVSAERSNEMSAFSTVADGASTALGNVRPTTMTMDKPTAQHTRAITSQPYLVYERPKTNMPKNYTEIRGVATNIFRPLKELAGFTVCSNVKLDGMPRALASEVDAIKVMLQSGVIFGHPSK